MEIVDLCVAMVLQDVVEVCEVVHDVPQRRLMERNGGCEQKGLEGLPGPLVPIL